MPNPAPSTGNNGIIIKPKMTTNTAIGQNMIATMMAMTIMSITQQPIDSPPAIPPAKAPLGGSTVPSPQRGQGIHSFFSRVRSFIWAKKASETLGSFDRLAIFYFNAFAISLRGL